MFTRKTQTKKFWVESFQIQDSDIEYLTNVLLETETPLTIDEMALLVVRRRVQLEEKDMTHRTSPDTIYRPGDAYEVGDELSFSQMDYRSGQVTAIREGENPDYGSFDVMTVAFDDGEEVEFASALATDHVLNQANGAEVEEEEEQLTADEIFIEYGGAVARSLEHHLADHDDLIILAGRWFPRSLLIDVNEGHLNLAEAVLFMHEGGPLATLEIMAQGGILQDSTERLAEFSLNYAMQEDDRFDEVGPAGKVLWFLLAQEPEEVRTPPPLLAYEPIDYNPNLLTDDLMDLEQRIADEHSPTLETKGIPQSVTITLAYPHWRSGTLPLSQQLSRMFPTAYEAPRIRFTLVDSETGDEYPAWVVRKHGYVYGLAEWLTEKEIPVGAYVTISSSEEPGVVEVGVETYKPRNKWVISAAVDGAKLRLDETQIPIGVTHDEQMLLSVEDTEAVDTLAQTTTRKDVPLYKLINDIIYEARDLNMFPSDCIDAKSLYSVVNLVKRCPPGPIFAELVSRPEFEHFGGPYWRLADT